MPQPDPRLGDFDDFARYLYTLQPPLQQLPLPFQVHSLYVLPSRIRFPLSYAPRCFEFWLPGRLGDFGDLVTNVLPVRSHRYNFLKGVKSSNCPLIRSTYAFSQKAPTLQHIREPIFGDTVSVLSSNRIYPRSFASR